MERDENEREKNETKEKERWDNFYEERNMEKVSLILEKFFEIENLKPGKAIDLGCGVSPDTKELIKHGWEVIGIDKQDVEGRIFYSLQKKERSLKICI